jgi:hypothetical protein
MGVSIDMGAAGGTSVARRLGGGRIRIRRYRWVLLGACALACGGKGLVVNEDATPPLDPEAPPSPDKSKVCVLRPTPTEGSTVHAVRDNGALVGGTRGASHFCYLAEPGEHTIRIDPAEPINLTAKAGRLFYLHEEVTEVMGTVVSKLAWMEEAEAKSLITSTKYVVVVSAPNGEQPAAVAPRR